MSKEFTKSEVKELAEFIVNALDDKKGKDIDLIDISEQSSLADYFVVCSGSSSTQIKALADEVEKQVEEQYGFKAKYSEGYESRKWVLLDYIDIVVHIFSEDTRDYYQLERLWMSEKDN